MATSETILQLEARRYRAMCEADLPVLDELLDDGLSYVHSNGVRDGKAAMLEGIGSRKWVFRKAERDNVTVRLYGACAVVNGEARFEIDVAGVPRKVHSRFTNVWVERAGGWKLVAWHATALPA